MYFFFLAGPGPPHGIEVSAFSRNSSGRCQYISTRLSPRLTRRISLKRPSVSPHFLALVFPLFLSFLLRLPCACTCQTSRRTTYLLGFLLSSSILSRLPYPILCCDFFSQVSSTMASNLFSGMFLTFYCHFNFYHVDICLQ